MIYISELLTVVGLCNFWSSFSCCNIRVAVRIGAQHSSLHMIVPSNIFGEIQFWSTSFRDSVFNIYIFLFQSKEKENFVFRILILEFSEWEFMEKKGNLTCVMSMF